MLRFSRDATDPRKGRCEMKTKLLMVVLLLLCASGFAETCTSGPFFKLQGNDVRECRAPNGDILWGLVFADGGTSEVAIIYFPQSKVLHPFEPVRAFTRVMLAPDYLPGKLTIIFGKRTKVSVMVKLRGDSN